LFEGVSRSELEVLAAQCEWLELTKSQPLFFQGDPVERLYLVVEGLIKVYRLDPKGDRQVVIHMNQSGQCIAAMAVFLHQPEYPASAEAAEASRVLAISAEALYRLVQQDLTLCNNMLRLVAECAQQVVQVLDRMVFRELDSRLAEYLLTMIQTHGQGFKLPTNHEIAAILGTTPEPVSRKLGHFSLQGWVKIYRRRIQITNPAALQALIQAN
jgi:CRP/FNR family transcriptional regulator